MPISIDTCTKNLLRREFEDLDYRIMGCAFDSHNTIGRLLPECAYQNSLKRRCEERGIAAATETRISVSYRSFIKSYYVDLIANGGAVYELKAVESLQPQHEAQLLNYLFLMNLNFGKIINFRPPSVQSRFVTTHLTPADRVPDRIDTSQFTTISSNCDSLPGLVESLLHDWGTHLDFNLYREAILHLLGIQSYPHEITLYDEGNSIGRIQCHLLNPSTMIHASGITKQFNPYRRNLERILRNTRLSFIQWINFAGRSITLETIN